LIAYGDPEETKKLPCPDDCELILYQAGLINQKIEEFQAGEYFWHSDTPQWKTHPLGFMYTPSYEKGKILNEDLYNQFLSFVGKDFKDIKDLKTVYGVVSNGQRKFEEHLKVMLGKKEGIKRLFLQQEWQLLPNVKRREQFWQTLLNKVNSFYWNQDGSEIVAMIPVVYGTDIDSAWKFCADGFSDAIYDGYYGKGIYFTTDLQTSRKWINFPPANPPENLNSPDVEYPAAQQQNQQQLENGEKNKKKTQENAYIVSLVMMGNTLPVIEHPMHDDVGKPFFTRDEAGLRIVPNPDGYYHKTVRRGYNSHYTIVPRDAPFDEAFPIKEPFDPEKHTDEIVLFQDSQILPLFVVTFNDEIN